MKTTTRSREATRCTTAASGQRPPTAPDWVQAGKSAPGGENGVKEGTGGSRVNVGESRDAHAAVPISNSMIVPSDENRAVSPKNQTTDPSRRWALTPASRSIGSTALDGSGATGTGAAAMSPTATLTAGVAPVPVQSMRSATTRQSPNRDLHPRLATTEQSAPRTRHRRPVVAATVVNGTVTFDHGEHTGELPGRVRRSGPDIR